MSPYTARCMNQWDPSFSHPIIYGKSTEEGDPAATEKRMGDALNPSSTSFAAIANRSVPERLSQSWVKTVGGRFFFKTRKLLT
jgi:hypothetical protein